MIYCVALCGVVVFNLLFEFYDYLSEAVTYKKPQILFYTINKANSFKALHIAWFFFYVKKSRRRERAAVIFTDLLCENRSQINFFTWVPLYFRGVSLSHFFFRISKWEFLCAGADQKYKNKVNITVTGKSEPPCSHFSFHVGGENNRDCRGRLDGFVREIRIWHTVENVCRGWGTRATNCHRPLPWATARNASRENLPRERSEKRFSLVL